MDLQPKGNVLGAMADMLTWAVMIAISLLGGAVSFARKMKEGHARAFNFTELIGELATSAFAGIIAFNLCQWREFDIRLTIALVGICSHMGTKAIMKAETYLSLRFPAPPTLPLEPDNGAPHESKS